MITKHLSALVPPTLPPITAAAVSVGSEFIDSLKFTILVICQFLGFACVLNTISKVIGFDMSQSLLEIPERRCRHVFHVSALDSDYLLPQRILGTPLPLSAWKWATVGNPLVHESKRYLLSG